MLEKYELVAADDMTSIAGAVREKLLLSEPMTVLDMSTAIKNAASNREWLVKYLRGELTAVTPDMISTLPITIENGKKTKNITVSAFNTYETLTSVVFPDDLGEYIFTIDKFAFCECRQLTNLKFTNTQRLLIKDYAFYNCRGLTEIEFPKGIYEIGTLAFNECSYLTKIVFRDKPKSIAYDAFAGCGWVTDIYVPWSAGDEIEIRNEWDGTIWGASNNAKIHHNS